LRLLCQKRAPFNVAIKGYDQKYLVTQVIMGSGVIQCTLDNIVSDREIETIKISLDPADAPQESTIITAAKYIGFPLLIGFIFYYCRNNPMSLTFFENI
jgi:hypothetical protein